MFASASVWNQTAKELTVTTQQQRPEQQSVSQGAWHSNQIERSRVTATPSWSFLETSSGPKACKKNQIQLPVKSDAVALRRIVKEVWSG